MSPESLKILYRLITCFQSSGRIGKSLVFEILLAWARFAGIPIAAVDCDAEHKTLSKRFPEAAFVDATRSNDEFLQLCGVDSYVESGIYLQVGARFFST